MHLMGTCTSMTMVSKKALPWCGLGGLSTLSDNISHSKAQAQAKDGVVAFLNCAYPAVFINQSLYVSSWIK